MVGEIYRFTHLSNTFTHHLQQKNIIDKFTHHSSCFHPLQRVFLRTRMNLSCSFTCAYASSRREPSCTVQFPLLYFTVQRFTANERAFHYMDWSLAASRSRMTSISWILSKSITRCHGACRFKICWPVNYYLFPCQHSFVEFIFPTIHEWYDKQQSGQDDFWSVPDYLLQPRLSVFGVFWPWQCNTLSIVSLENKISDIKNAPSWHHF